MTKLSFLAALALVAALPGCAGQSIPPPMAAADQTVIDEKASILAETAYTGASRLGFVAAKSGLIDRERFKALDARAYAALGVVRTAYRTGNAAGFDVAVRELNTILAQINALASGA